MKYAALILLLLTGCSPEPPKTDRSPHRVISMAPSITECVFSAGAGNYLVGISSFCTFPAETAALPKTGGYTDTNYEAIVGLKPDLVLTLPAHSDARHRLKTYGIATSEIDTGSIGSITNALLKIGALFETENAAQKTVRSLQETMESIRKKTSGRQARAVLILVGRSIGTGTIRDAYVAGPGTLYQEMLDLIGAENAYTGNDDYARLSAEGLLQLNPEIIIELMPGSSNAQVHQARTDWQQLKTLPAISENRLHCLTGGHVSIPGPRFIQTLEDITRAVYPDVFSEAP